MSTQSVERAARAPSAEKTLQQLFLTLFLRGRTSRGLQKAGAPTSIGTKLLIVLFINGSFGLVAFLFWNYSIFDLSAGLHSLTFVFLGMLIASSSGEMLFNKEEADILLHRPVLPRALLWAKVRVIVRISLWLAGALNLVGLLVGVIMPAGARLFPIAHAVSVTLEALFCAACVVMVYQLCLRWFGRERLEGLMTTAQVIVAVSAALAGQLVPQLIGSFGGNIGIDLSMKRWWLALLPPVWFAALDDALVGTHGFGSWTLAGLAVLATLTVSGIAFGKLARDYERGLQALNETSAPTQRAAAVRRWFDVMASRPPLSWWLRDSVARASFLLTAAYLVRDRDMKLRMYPSLAPLLVMPLVFLFRAGRDNSGGFGRGFGAAYLGSVLSMVAPAALAAVRSSQQWRASDVFRAAPILGPAQLSHGARRAVLLVITLPLLILFGFILWLSNARSSDLQLLLPGLIALPVFALAPCVTGRMIPLSEASEGTGAIKTKFTFRRVIYALMVLTAPFVVSGLGALARYFGWFWWYVGGEALVAIPLYIGLRAYMASLRWRPLE